MPGESKERRAFKAAARAKAMQGMRIQAGPAYKPHEAPAAPPGSVKAYPDKSPPLATPQPMEAPTQQDLEHTAKIHNIPVDDVKRRLGIQ
jgi:hypothetical protein